MSARPHVARLRVYPVKGLDAEERETAVFDPGGTLAGDRALALFDADGGVVNGKRTDVVHRLRSTYDPGADVLTLRGAGDPPDAARSFHLDGERGAAEAWFAERLGEPVELRRAGDVGFVDRPDAGPSVVTTATLEAVASWFDDLSVESVRRRLRANVEVGGVPAFWEDRFVGVDAPAFEVVPDPDRPTTDASTARGSTPVRFEGVEPCGRCVVPTRDPDTGEPTPGFRERFVERRAATFPDWADPDAFPHHYALMLIARVPPASRDGRLRVGDRVRVVDGD